MITSSSGRERRAARSPIASPRTKHVSVLLLEAGGKDNYHVDPHSRSAISTASRTREPTGVFRRRPKPGLNGRTLALSAWQGSGRLLIHQRHDLHARTGAGLQSCGARMAVPAGAGMMCCPISRSQRIIISAPTNFHGCGRRMACRRSTSPLGYT